MILLLNCSHPFSLAASSLAATTTAPELAAGKAPATGEPPEADETGHKGAALAISAA